MQFFLDRSKLLVRSGTFSLYLVKKKSFYFYLTSSDAISFSSVIFVAIDWSIWWTATYGLTNNKIENMLLQEIKKNMLSFVSPATLLFFSSLSLNAQTSKLAKKSQISDCACALGERHSVGGGGREHLWNFHLGARVCGAHNFITF